MAPEQAGGPVGRDGSRAPVGPATDVYALGAILYEMLSGRPPFKAATPLDTILQVVSEEPVAPSRLQPRLPRDLETICLKCLEKEPRRRYASAAALAEDLRRFQADEPILARAATVWERAVKWARRRPARAALLILSITSPLTLAVISLSYQARLQDQNQSLQTALTQVQTERDNVARAKQDVEREHQRAQAHLEKALEAVDRLLKRVGDENTTNVPQLVELRKKVLEEALDFYRGFLKQEGDEPAIRRETARAYQRSAGLYFMLSKSAEAERASREAIKLQEKLVAEDPQQAAYRSDLSKSYSYLAHVYATTNRFKECYAAYDKALELSERLAREHPENSDYVEGFVRDCSNRGYSLQHQNPRESEKYFRMAVDKAEQLLAAHPGSDYYQCVVAGLYTNIATALLAQQRVAAARALLQKSSGMLVPADRPPPRSAPEYKATLAMTQVQQGLVSLRTNQPAQALASLEAGAAGFEEVLADTPKMLPYRFQLVTTYPTLADLHMQFKQPARALAALQRAAALAEGLAQDYPSFAWLTPEVERLRIQCLVIQARQGEAATTLAAAGRLADKKSLTGENAYDLACVYALAATNPRTRKDAADALLQRALALLLRADAAGYFAAKARIEHARKDGDLEPLHARDEFKKLLDRAEIRLKNSPSAAKTG
jgi:serine/threonine-protein kinase